MYQRIINSIIRKKFPTILLILFFISQCIICFYPIIALAHNSSIPEGWSNDTLIEEFYLFEKVYRIKKYIDTYNKERVLVLRVEDESEILITDPKIINSIVFFWLIKETNLGWNFNLDQVNIESKRWRDLGKQWTDFRLEIDPSAYSNHMKKRHISKLLLFGSLMVAGIGAALSAPITGGGSVVVFMGVLTAVGGSFGAAHSYIDYFNNLKEQDEYSFEEREFFFKTIAYLQWLNEGEDGLEKIKFYDNEFKKLGNGLKYVSENIGLVAKIGKAVHGISHGPSLAMFGASLINSGANYLINLKTDQFKNDIFYVKALNDHHEILALISKELALLYEKFGNVTDNFKYPRDLYQNTFKLPTLIALYHQNYLELRKNKRIEELANEDAIEWMKYYFNQHNIESYFIEKSQAKIEAEKAVGAINIFFNTVSDKIDRINKSHAIALGQDIIDEGIGLDLEKSFIPNLILGKKYNLNILFNNLNNISVNITDIEVYLPSGINLVNVSSLGSIDGLSSKELDLEINLFSYEKNLLKQNNEMMLKINAEYTNGEQFSDNFILNLNVIPPINIGVIPNKFIYDNYETVLLNFKAEVFTNSLVTISIVNQLKEEILLTTKNLVNDNSEIDIQWIIPDDVSCIGPYSIKIQTLTEGHLLDWIIPRVFCVLPDIYGDISNFNYENTVILSQQSDKEIVEKIAGSLCNALDTEIHYFDNVDNTDLINYLINKDLILVGGDQANDFVRILKEEGKLFQEALWFHQGNASVQAVDAWHGHRAIVISGYTAEDTAVAGLKAIKEISLLFPKIRISAAINNNEITFDNTFLSTTPTESFTITNEGAEDLRIDSWTLDNPVFSLIPSNPTGPIFDVILQKGESIDVNIKFSPQAVGDYNGTIVINSNDPQNPDYFLQVKGKCIETQGGIVLNANSSSLPLGSSTLITAIVSDDNNNIIGEGHNVAFYTSTAGQWSDYDHCNFGICFSLTNNQGEATITWTPEEVENATIIGASEYGKSNSIQIAVTAPTLKVEDIHFTRYGGDNLTYSDYRYDIVVKTQEGTPISNENVSWAVSHGTIMDHSDTQTNLAGHAEMHIRFSEQKPFVATVTILGTSNSTTHPVRILPGAPFPAGRMIPLNVPVSSMDLCANGTKAAFGGEKSIAVLDLSNDQVKSKNFGEEILNGINAVSINNIGTKVGVAIRYRQRGIIDASSLTGTFPVTSKSEGINDALSAAWVCDRLLLSNDKTDNYPKQFSLYNTSANLLFSCSVTDSKLDDFSRIVVRPGTCQFAAICNGSPSSDHNWVHYGYVSGNSIGKYNSFLTSFRNHGVAWSGNGSQLAVGSSSWYHQVAIYNTSSLSTGTPSQTIFSIDSGADYIAYSSDDAYVAIAQDSSNIIYIYEPSGWSQLYIISSNLGCKGLEWIPGTHILLTGGGNHVQYIYLDDIQDPSVSISSPEDGSHITQTSLNVTGHANDASGIKCMRIRMNGGSWENLGLNSGQFSHQVSLELGENTIEVEATDNAGRKSGDSISVTRITDNKGPVIFDVSATFAGSPRPGLQLTISAMVTDNLSGVDDSTVKASIQKPNESDIDNVQLTLGSGDTFLGTWDSTGADSGTYFLDITANDNSGNSTEVENARVIEINKAPNVSITDPAGDLQVYSGDNFSISWITIDFDSNAITSLYMDKNRDASSGLIPIPGAIGMDEATTSIYCNHGDFSPGTYNVYAVASDNFGSSEAWSNGKIIIHDAIPPYTFGYNPYNGCIDVPINADIIAFIGDDMDGVDLSTIVMTVEGNIIYDGASPASYPHATVTGDSLTYKLTYSPTSDFLYEQEIIVTIDASDLSGNSMETKTYSFFTEKKGHSSYYVAPPPLGNDSNDGFIPESPFATIHHSINIAKGGETNPVTIYIAAGTYYENVAMDEWESLEGGWNINFNNRWDFKNDGLEPSAEYETIIDGQNLSSTIIAANNTRIDGFSIRNGGNENTHYAGGIECHDGISPHILNSNIYGNITNGEGGGISLHYQNCNAIIENNLIHHNMAGKFGGGISCSQSSPIIRNNKIYENICSDWGGGISYYNGSSPIICNNEIYQNENFGNAGGGIYGELPTLAVIKNNLIYENMNSGQNGAGIVCVSGNDPLIINNTIYGNDGGIKGGGIYVGNNSAPSIKNCIIWDNLPEGIYADSSSGNFKVNFSNIQFEEGKIYSGLNNKNEDPLFVAPLWGDFHLEQDSPCIDAGINELTIKEDIDGMSRPQDGDGDGIAICDMGAYENPTIIQNEMNLTGGWSMISLPIIPDSLKVSDLFPGSVIVYGYNKGIGYERMKGTEDLKVGSGYWILLDQNQTYTLTGQPINSNTITVKEDGWYMIGGCTSDAKALGNNCNIRVIYGYEQGSGYKRIQEGENLEPGKGYWILFENVVDQANLTVQGRIK